MGVKHRYLSKKTIETTQVESTAAESLDAESILCKNKLLDDQDQVQRLINTS